MNLFEHYINEQCTRELFIEQHFGSLDNCDRILDEMFSMKGAIDYIRRKFGIGEDQDVKTELIKKLHQYSENPDSLEKTQKLSATTFQPGKMSRTSAFNTGNAYGGFPIPKKRDPESEYSPSDVENSKKKLEDDMLNNPNLSEEDRMIIRKILNGEFASQNTLHTYKAKRK